MLCLGLDCATPYLALALLERKGEEMTCLAQFSEEVGRDHAVRITPELDALFARAARPPAALEAVAVGTGPGSYTGLRIGIAAAQALAFAQKATLRGEATLAAMAAQVFATRPAWRNQSVTVALDARRGNVYTASYFWQGGEVRLDAANPIRKCARAELVARETYQEGVAPSADYLARRAARGSSDVTALYL